MLIGGRVENWGKCEMIFFRSVIVFFFGLVAFFGCGVLIDGSSGCDW